MQIKEFLNNVCEQIKYKPIRNEIAEELENHIKEAKENYIQEGIEEIQAEQKAISQMGKAEEIGKKLNKIHKPKLDWKLLIMVVITLAFGFLVAFTRAIKYEIISLGGETRAIIVFAICTVIGLLLSIAIYFFDYKKLQKHAKYLYTLATAIIILSIIFSTNTYRRIYLNFGIARVSPAILTMPLYIIAFVGFIQNLKKQSKIKIAIQEKEFNISLLKIIIILSITSILLFLAIDHITSAVILALTYLIISTIKLLKLKENRKKYITILWSIPIILVILMTCLLVNNGMFRINRIIGSFNPELDPTGAGWQGMLQKQVINSAKLIGEADIDVSVEDNLTKEDYLIVFDEGTNFAFTSILSHYGWLISVVMVMAIILLNTKLIINSIKIKDEYGKLLIVGISTTFILQSIFNLLMNLNLGIKADFNIPLISYSGIGLIINMMSLAVTFSVYRRKDIIHA